MLAAYRKGGAAVAPDVSLKDIERVMAMEQRLGKNLAPLVLSGTQIEQVAQARGAYKALETVYEKGSPLEKAITDLVLSESLEPEAETRAVVEYGAKALPLLCQLLESSEFISPLTPGYGLAAQRAAQALGKLGNSSAIAALFGVMHRSEEPLVEEACVNALVQLGEPALQFVLRRVAARPLTSENDTAAYALTCWTPTPEIQKAAKQLLEDTEISKRYPLSDYLKLIT